MIAVENAQEFAELVKSESHIRVVGGGTKSATVGHANVTTSKMSGVLQYDPGEFTFTALAGTRVEEIENLLAKKNQYLPFDAPLVAAGATLGGTVASGHSGSGRFRYGGVRDFLLGATFITGNGVPVTTGSKVVKNAAGFDFPKLMVGSLGCYGLMTELTFKVFPQPQASATVVFQATSLLQAVELLVQLAGSQMDLACLDMDSNHQVFARLCGFENAVPKRVQRLRESTEASSLVLPDDQEADWWNDAREFRWLPEGYDLVKIPATPSRISKIVGRLSGIPCRFTVGGNVAWIGWPSDQDAAELETSLRELHCSGVFLTGSRKAPFLNHANDCAFNDRLRDAMDPDRKFSLQPLANV